MVVPNKGSILFNRYNVEEFIGEGSTGQVYLVSDTNSRTKKAIKLIDVEKHKFPLEAVLRFRSESEFLKSIHHQNIIKYYDFCQDENLYGLVTGYNPGGTLQKYILANKTLELNTLLDILVQISGALHEIHTAGLVHHDLKSANIIFNDQQPRPNLHILDFGLSHLIEHQQNRVTGTLAYMAPEITGILKKVVDHRADLYSLGIIAYELATNSLPFNNPEPAILMHQHLAETPISPIEINKSIPLVLNNMILKLLRKDPVDRYNSAQGFLRDLNKLIRYHDKNGNHKTEFKIALEDQWDSFPAENPFIGRKQIIQQLDHFSQSAKTICLIEGARGIGKSSLVKKFYNDSKANPKMDVFFFRPHKEEKPVRLSGLSGLLQSILEFIINEPWDKQTERIEKLKALTQNEFYTLLKILPELEQICKSHNIEFKKTKINDPLLLCQRLLEYKIKQGQHIVLLIDDVQYLDEQSLNIIYDVSKKIEATRISLIISYNSELVPIANKSLIKKLENDVSVLRINLEPFLESQTAELLQELFSHSLADLPQLLEPLQDVSGGNPRRLRNLLQDLIDSELLYLEGKTWKTKSDQALEFIINNKNQDSGHVLKHFSEDELEVLQRGSIFHRAFSIPAILALEKTKVKKSIEKLKSDQESTESILKILDKARAPGIITVDSKNLYSFRDHSLRTFIREQIDEKTRKSYHHGVAMFLHKNILNQSSLAIYDIAHHYDRAGKDYQAMRHYVLAARLTDDQNYQNKQSQIYYNLAANKIRAGKVESIATKKKFDILFTSAFHNYTINAASFDTGADIRLLQDLIENNKTRKLKLLTLKANHAFNTGDRKAMVSFAEQAMNISGVSKDNFYYLNCLTLLGIVPSGKSFTERAAIMEQIVETSFNQNNFNDIGRSLTILVNMLAYIGEFNKAQTWIQKAQTIIKKQSPNDIVAVFFAKGMLYIEKGSFSNFRKIEKDLKVILEKLPAMSRYFLEAHSARVYAMLGEFKPALIIFERLLDNQEKSVQKVIAIVAYYGRMILANKMEEHQLALDYFDIATEFLKLRPDPYKQAELDLEAAYACVSLGRFETAKMHIDSAITAASELNSKTLNTHVEFYKAFYDWHQNKNKKALDEAKKAVQTFQKIGAEGWAEIYSGEITKWERGNISSSGSTVQTSSPESRELYQLLEINQKISSMLDSQSLLKEVLSGAMRITGAQHGYLFLTSNLKEPELSLDSRGQKIPAKNQSFSKHVVSKCEKTTQSITTRDAIQEKKWNTFESIIAHEMKSILAVPILHQGELHGILYLDNHAASSVFSVRDTQIVENFAIQAAIAMYNARLFEREKIARTQTESTLAIFERFIPKNFTDRFAEGNVESLKAGLSKEENLTILFSDIRNFTSLSESMDVSNLFILLNDYLKFMELPIRNARGFVDKYIGDAIMAIFDQTPTDAIEAAIGMQRALRKLNYLKKKRNAVTLDTGIGINTGVSMIGVIGSRDRIDTTVMGDTVNTASRIEALTKIYKTPILISEETWNTARHRENLNIRFVDSVRILGKKKNTNIYEVFNQNDKNDIELKIKYRNLFEDAWQTYSNSDWLGATILFKEYQKLVINDELPQVFLDRIAILETRNPVDWDGIYLQDAK